MILVVSICCCDDVSGFWVVPSVVPLFGFTGYKGLQCPSGLLAIDDQVKYIMYSVIRPDCNSPDLGIFSENIEYRIEKSQRGPQ